MAKMKEMVNKIEESKNGKETIQVTIAFLAVGILIFLRARGILVLNNTWFALLGGTTAFLMLQYVTKKQKLRKLDAILEEAEPAEEVSEE